MKGLETVERKLWSIATGSRHSHYRQALWRPSRQPRFTVALSDVFTGKPEAAGPMWRVWDRKGWMDLGVVAVDAAAWSEFVNEHAEETPATVFTMPDGSLGVGKLQSFRDIGAVRHGNVEYAGHGFRLGPDNVQFGIGSVGVDGVISTPDPEALATLESTFVELVGVNGTPWQAMNFS